MPEIGAFPSGYKNKGGAYVDRDKPAQIRYSNISAGKGEDIPIKSVRNTDRDLFYCVVAAPHDVQWKHESGKVVYRYKHDNICMNAFISAKVSLLTSIR